MYHVYIKVEPDKDFGYKNNLKGFNKDTEDADLYFNDRDNITTVLKNFYREMCETLHTSKDYMEDTIQQIKDTEKYADLIFEKIENFMIDFDFGNQYIVIEVSLTAPKITKIQDSDETIAIYDKGRKTFPGNLCCFDSYSIKDYWDWDKIKIIPPTWKE
jgi:hypothetical protein